MPLDTSESRFERWRTRGDGAALSDVFDALAPGLLRLAIHLVGDPAAAEDLVQQTFVTAIERAATWDGKRALEPWLQGILANHARDLRKSARRAHAPDFDLEAVLAREDEAPLEAASRRELAGELARAVDALEEPYRAAVLLRLRHGMDAADIAHVLGRSPGAVRVQLHRAREMLRKSLPAGIAGALVLLADSARGLEKVRNQVLEHAARLAPAAGASGALLGGVLVMKKVLVAAAIVLALAAAWWWTQRPAGPVEVALRDSVAAVDTLERTQSASARAEPIAPDDLPERAPVDPVAVSSTDDSQPFRVRVVDGLSGAPISGARIAFHAPKFGPWTEVRARWPERFAVGWRGEALALEWPWFRASPTARQRLGLDPILSYEGPMPGEEPVATATSDARGEAVVELSAQQAFVVVEHASYVTRGMAPILERTLRFRKGDELISETFRDDALIVQLFQQRTLRGQLIDLDGQALALSTRLQVEGFGPGDQTKVGPRTTLPVGSWTVTTKSDGSFEVAVGAKDVSVRPLDPGWAVAYSGVHPVRKERWTFGGTHVPGSAETAWIPLMRIPTLTVLHAEDRSPVQDYWLQIRVIGAGWPLSDLSRIRSADGRTALADLDELQSSARGRQADARAVHVFAEGFLPGLVECADLNALGNVEILLQRGAGLRIAGRVLDGGRPLPGAHVLLVPSAPNIWECGDSGAGAASTTDADGRFSICAAPGGWVVHVEHDGRSQCRFVELPGAEPIAIDLARDTAIEIAVDDEPGASFDDVWASVMCAGKVNQNTRVDPQGRARFGSLPAGRYTAKVGRKAVEYSAVSGGAEFDLAEGDTRSVRFARDGARAARHALLVVEGLAQIEGWKARAWGGGNWIDVERDGRVPVDLGARPERLEVRAPDARTYRFLVPHEGAAEPVLRLAPARGRRHGILRRANGSPESSRVVVAQFTRDENGLERVACPTDHEGRFRLDALPAGTRQFAIEDARGNDEHDGFAWIRFESASASDGAGSELVIDLPPGLDAGNSGGQRLTLHGFVLDGGKPDAGRTLRIEAIFDAPGGTLSAATSTTVLSDGSYALPTVPALRHAAACWFGGGRPAFREEFTLPLDVAEVRRDFELR